MGAARGRRSHGSESKRAGRRAAATAATAAAAAARGVRKGRNPTGGGMASGIPQWNSGGIPPGQIALPRGPREIYANLFKHLGFLSTKDPSGTHLFSYFFTSALLAASEWACKRPDEDIEIQRNMFEGSMGTKTE